jgi:reverse gyrase
MKPIHKFNNGRGATLCHLCRTIITVGKPTNDLYCDRCLSERNHTEAEFLILKANLKKADAVKANFTMQEYYEQMDKEVHFNRNNLGV